MLRKVRNTLRYGDKQTKGFLLTVGVLGFVSIVLLVTAVITLLPLFWVGTAATVLITVAMAKNARLAVIKDNSNRDDTGVRERKEDKEDFGEDALATMTEEKMKRLFVRYKVKQEHVPVVIDLCVSEHIKQAPGFAWVDGDSLKILLIEESPRMIERPVSALQVMEVERGIAVRASGEYTGLRETDWMRKVFMPYLPQYHKKQIGGRTVLLKNLYVLDEDIKFSSPSVKELKKLFAFRIEIAERRLSEGNLNPYYKELFVSSVLWKDGILNLKEYQQEVEQVLFRLAAPDISYSEFDNTLSSVINAGLLPAEYREYAYKKREERKNVVPDGKEKRKKRK